MPNPRIAEVSRLLYRRTGHGHTAWKDGMVKRVKPSVKISTESIDFKAPHSAKTKQAWRYAGNKIVRAPSTKLGNRVYVDPKDPDLPRRKQESNFFLTINSNKSPSPEDTDMCYKAMESMLERLKDERVIATYIKFGPKDDSYTDDRYEDVINSVDWKAAIEQGDKMNRVHTHIWMTVSHYSQIQINIKGLQRQARMYYNSASFEGQRIASDSALHMRALPYVHVKLLPQSDWTDVMRQYIHKAMIS